MTRRLSDAEHRLWGRVSRTVAQAKWRAPASSGETTARTKTETSAKAKAGAAPPATVEKTAAGLAKGEAGRRREAPALARPHARTPVADASGHRRVRRGKLDIEATLDLHGHTQDSALAALTAFVAQGRALGSRSLLVITGKGRAGGGVLRKRFLDWLDRPEIREHVAGYSSAHQRHGGEGAFYVLLKAPRKAR